MANEIKVAVIIEGQQAQRALAALSKGTTKFEKSATKSFGKVDAAIASFAGNLAAIGASKALAVITAQFFNAAEGALELSGAIAEINSILPENEKITKKTTQTFLEFSNSFSGTAANQAKAFYNIVSAGVKTTSTQLETLAVANKAAVAGLVDIDTAATVLVSSVNAYATSSLTAGQASDALFVAVREGQTNFTRLASTIGRVAPLASAAGISFAELTGTLAFVTKSGVSTDEAVTGLRSAIASLIKPSEGAKKAAAELGIELSTRGIKAAGGLANFFKILRERTGGSEVALAKLFPNIRALAAVINITRGDFEDFTRILKETENAAGSTSKAFEEISKSAQFQFARLQQELANIPQAFLINFEKPVASAIESMRDLIPLVQVGFTTAVSLAANGLILFFDAFDKINSILPFVRISVLTLQDALLATIETALQAQIAIADFFGIEPELANEQIESTRELREEIAKTVIDTTNAALADSISTQVKIANIKQFQAEVAAANEAILNGENENNNQRLANDAAFLKAKNEQEILALEEKEITLESMEGAKREAELERRDLEKAEKQLAQDEELQRVAFVLGEEETIRQQAAVNRLERQNKFNSARKKRQALEEKAEKESIFRIERFRDLTQKQRIQNLRGTLGTISTLQNSSSKELFFIGKLAAVSVSVIDGLAAVQKALASAPPPINFALAALVGGIAAANTAKIASAKPPASSGGNFQGGGVVGGSSFTGDNLSVGVNSREVILNQRQTSNLFNQIESGKDLFGQLSQISSNANGQGGVAGSLAIIEKLEDLNQTLANMPAPVVNVSIDEKDIVDAVRDGQEDGRLLEVG